MAFEAEDLNSQRTQREKARETHDPVPVCEGRTLDGSRCACPHLDSLLLQPVPQLGRKYLQPSLDTPHARALHSPHQIRSSFPRANKRLYHLHLPLFLLYDPPILALRRPPSPSPHSPKHDRTNHAPPFPLRLPHARKQRPNTQPPRIPRVDPMNHRTDHIPRERLPKPARKERVDRLVPSVREVVLG